MGKVMARTRSEQSEYNRGHYRGRMERDEVARATEARMSAIIARAERAEAGHGYGQCRDCVHWARYEPRTKWGACNEPNAQGDKPWPWPWMDADIDQIRRPANYRMFTNEKFGCVNFATRPTTSSPDEAKGEE